MPAFRTARYSRAPAFSEPASSARAYVHRRRRNRSPSYVFLWEVLWSLIRSKASGPDRTGSSTKMLGPWILLQLGDRLHTPTIVLQINWRKLIRLSGTLEILLLLLLPTRFCL